MVDKGNNLKLEKKMKK